MNIHSTLEIKSLTLPVHLGQSKEERDKPQEVVFHITVGFRTAPKEEQTDHLNQTGQRGGEEQAQSSIQDSVCYFALCESVQKLVTKNRFCLIEKLANTVLENLKVLLPEKASLKVCVHKVKPPVPFLKGGVSYTCGDLSLP